jgi:tRNA nucleotidyltransferase (CCA-adding enzyme)
LSTERVFQEWTKTLDQVRYASGAFRMWREAGALDALLPALTKVPEPFFAAIDHVPLASQTRRVERASLRSLTRLAVPFVSLGGAGAREALLALRASNHEAAFAGAVAESWASVADSLTSIARSTDTAVPELRRIVARIGRLRVHGTMRCFSALWAAARTAGQDAPSHREAASLTRRMLRIAWSDPIALSDLAVTGTDLQEAGVRAGPALGRILQALLDRVIDDPALNTSARLLVLARAFAEET